MTIALAHRLDKIVLPGGIDITELDNQKWDAGIDSLLGYAAIRVTSTFETSLCWSVMVFQ